MFEINIESVEFVMACIVLVLFAVQMYYWLAVYRLVSQGVKKQAAKPKKSLDEMPPMSVVIVTKDSGKMLYDHLVRILEQDYPKFEVVVVNDMSSGEDEDILKLLETKYTNLYHTFIPSTARYISLKKLGIAMGIKASRYDWIVVTEPNCYPASNKWLQSLANHIDDRTDIVLGYSNYTLEEVKTGLFYRRIITDNLFTSMRYLGKAIKGHPYMGIGRNMVYRKALYERHKGFAHQLNLLRGEDDLFVNALAKRRNTRVAVEADSIVKIMAPVHKRLWFAEKVSLLVTGDYYKGLARTFNAIESITCFLIHILAMAGIAWAVWKKQWVIGASIALLWLIRYVMVCVIMNTTAKSMGEKKLFFLPLFDLIRPLWSCQLKMKYWFRTKNDYMRH